MYQKLRKCQSYLHNIFGLFFRTGMQTVGHVRPTVAFYAAHDSFLNL